MILAPDLLQTNNGGTRQPGRLLANQSRERFGKVAGGDAFEVQDRDEHLQALRAPGIRRQDRGLEPNARGRSRLTVAHAGLADGDQANAGHHLTLRQMPVAHEALKPVRGFERGVLSEEIGNLGLNGLRQQGAGALAQDIGQRIGKAVWLGELEDVMVRQGVSLLWWRSGGSNTPTIRRFIPSGRLQLLAIPQGSPERPRIW